MPLIEGLRADALMADKAYDTNEILAHAAAHRRVPVIPPKKNRKDQRDYDTYYIAFAIWLKTPSCASKAGAVLPHATPNVPLPSSPLSKSAALSFGSLSRDHTI